MIKFLLLLPLWFASPALEMNWANESRRDLSIRFMENQAAFVKACVHGGLVARYRYELQVCHRNHYWFDECSSPKLEVHSVQFDPITESYKLMADRHADELEPVVRHLASFPEALSALSTIESVSLAEIAGDDAPAVEEGAAYLSTRVVGDCKGDFNKTLSAISSFLTFGLVRVSGFDSGWADFQAKP